MKRLLYLVVILSSLYISSCDDEYVMSTDTTHKVDIQLLYPEEENLESVEGVNVKLTSSLGISFETATDARGKATFMVPNGIYEATANEQRTKEFQTYYLHGINSGVIVSEEPQEKPVVVEMISSRSSQIIIKELYNGGVQKDDGSGNYQLDKYAIIYNNSGTKVSLKNFCLGMVNPYNAQGGTNDYGLDGKLTYADKGYIPGGCAIWYLTRDFVLEPYQQAVIALNGAIDHTIAYKKSVDLSRADYCTYDMDDFDNTIYYPAPSDKIPTSNYFMAYKYGKGNAWPLSVSSPAFFIFKTEGMTPEEFASTQDYHYTNGREGNISFCCAKVPTKWIIDAIEVFSTPELAKSRKRLTPDIDSGFASLTNQNGYSMYRNVNKEATEGILGNKEKLVYNYVLGTKGSTDPTNIDAEASIKNGAVIIYQDTNNSTADFHQRKQASLKD